MPLIHYIEHDGTAHAATVAEQTSVMQGALDNGVAGIAAECGGGLACATCHCYVDAAWLDRIDPPTATELDMLEATSSERRANSRLSCQIVVTEAQDGLTVRLPETQY